MSVRLMGESTWVSVLHETSYPPDGFSAALPCTSRGRFRARQAAHVCAFFDVSWRIPPPAVWSTPIPNVNESMNLHEYQSKALFAEYGIPVPKGQVATTPAEAKNAAVALGGNLWVVKAQVHAGGRGKAGGVKLA